MRLPENGNLAKVMLTGSRSLCVETRAAAGSAKTWAVPDDHGQQNSQTYSLCNGGEESVGCASRGAIACNFNGLQVGGARCVPGNPIALG